VVSYAPPSRIQDNSTSVYGSLSGGQSKVSGNRTLNVLQCLEVIQPFYVSSQTTTGLEHDCALTERTTSTEGDGAFRRKRGAHLPDPTPLPRPKRP